MDPQGFQHDPGLNLIQTELQKETLFRARQHIPYTLMQEPRQRYLSTIRSPKGNPSGSPVSCSRVGEAWHCARASASPQSRSPKALRGLAPQDGHVSDPAANLARPQSPWLPDNVISYPPEKLGLQMATSRARELLHTRPEVFPWWAASGPQRCGERDAALQRAPQAGDCSPGGPWVWPQTLL